MKLTFIDCSCGNTKGFQLADKLAECTSCALPVHIDTPSYHTYELDSLSKIEQRAKEQAVIDMWIDNMSYIDWHTCFDTNNISQANKCITCYEQGFISYLDNKDSCQIDTCPENRVAI